MVAQGGAPAQGTGAPPPGAIGLGSHSVGLCANKQGRTWIGVQFGLRRLGHKTAAFFLEVGDAKEGMDVEPLLLDLDIALGADYLACMKLAGRYANPSHDWVCSGVARLLTISPFDTGRLHRFVIIRVIRDRPYARW